MDAFFYLFPYSICERSGSVTVLRKNPSVVYWLGDKLYLNITNRCSNDCYFCLRRFKDGVRGFNLKLRGEPSSKEVVAELQKGIRRKLWKEVVFCGFGEPLMRLDCILEVTSWVKRFHEKVVRVDTNGHGFLLNAGRDVVRELREAHVDRVSVSLNAQDEETYNRVCRPKFQGAFEKIFEFVEKAKEVGLEIEITVVRIPEVDVREVREIAKRREVEFRVREYIPCIW
ncbi:MAG: radical SAM protein [Candidatus Bathyarchaeota archaeon]|nr:MAG: radical SAM protein [Candidatus Bathyarchaeota archaeon]